MYTGLIINLTDMELTKASIVNELTQQVERYEDLQNMTFEVPEWMKTEKKKVGRPIGSKNVTKHVEDRLVFNVSETGVPYFEKVKVTVKKAESHIAILQFSCGACYVDGFNMAICKRISNYKTMKYNDANPVCKHLRNCPGCELLKTFILLHTYNESQSLPILRNDVAKFVQNFKTNGQYPTIIN
jgi:hypothetical protein